MVRYFSVFLLSVILWACGIKQPVENNNEQQTGSIFVDSDPDSALIFLDGQNTFQVTPDTLSHISPGRHIIHVQKSGYRTSEDSVVVQVGADSLVHVTFTLQKLVYIGQLALASQPSGAEIFIDGQSTGHYTPDTLQLPPANYAVSLVKNGFQVFDSSLTVENAQTTNLSTTLDIQQRLVFESFGNVSCEPCVTSAENLEKFRDSHPDPNYVLFEYYANWPSPNDPFYKVSPKDVDERVQYYKIYTLPKLRLNGETGVDAADYDAIQNAFAVALAKQNTELAISADKRFTGDSLKVTIEIYDYGNLLQNDQLRLFVLIFEDDIHLNNPPGSNGLKDFNFVFRRFLSDRKGDVINNTPIRYALEWPDWVYANCRVVAFIQDISTKKIYQATEN